MEQRTGVLAGIGVCIAILVLFAVLYWTVSGMREAAFRRAYSETDSAYREVFSAVGQKSADSQQKMGEFVSAWERFFSAYRLNVPPPLNSDESWRSSMNTIDGIVKETEVFVSEGRLDDAYVSLQRIGTSWYQIFDRNTASMIGFYLLAFRDSLDTAEAQAGVLDYARLDGSCQALRAGWNDVRNAPVYMPKNRADVFDEYLWTEKLAIDSFCDAVSARDDINVRDSVGQMRQGFDEVYIRYN